MEKFSAEITEEVKTYIIYYKLLFLMFINEIFLFFFFLIWKINKIIKILSQLIVAVSLFHMNKVVHFDLKPGNIFVDSDVNVVVGVLFNYIN
jgi:serine/threonine protein kinase